ncbi:saccharopine dehydrogenase NADP-binding domain-containing protein [Nocardia yamanashiensis]|uniref:saccharopine dehydrogenase family protein n=1 Tax=Nocardia yamanashiensis TaxID=209247 RepID=UPI001E573FBA|nr:saccharopine dehydrogenase NADP-binding domain-containing protein [Nocardia yamanashiensis]UGT40937.1 saccharopine dehydrogenase NADP-binding domain-containing protein [Nocardia yamanashiensis]
MRVLALGGAGAMGAAAVRVAADFPDVDEIVIADRDIGAARALAADLSDATVRLRVAQVDVTDSDGLRAALEEADVVLNTVGPYYEFGITVLRAAIATGTDYLDICDDWEPTLDMLALDAEARAAGVCAIVGMGASPGVSNLLAWSAARDLDSVRDVYTAWPVDAAGADDDRAQLIGPDGRPSAAAVHWMQQISGTIATVGDGRLVRQRPLRPVRMLLPGDRRGTAYTVGHPEPVTLHRSLEITGDAVNLMVIKSATVAYLDDLRRDIDAGALSNQRAAALLAEPGAWRGIRSLLAAPLFRSPGTLPPFFAVATGTRAGRPETVLARLSGGLESFAISTDMATATGIPLALGLSQLVAGRVRRPGVHPPETIIDPDRFFAGLLAHLGAADAESGIVLERSPLAPVTDR